MYVDRLAPRKTRDGSGGLGSGATIGKGMQDEDVPELDGQPDDLILQASTQLGQRWAQPLLVTARTKLKKTNVQVSEMKRLRPNARPARPRRSSRVLSFDC
jgi:hypothetical protein